MSSKHKREDIDTKADASKKQKPNNRDDETKAEPVPKLPPLLRLPAELRNTIFEYALVTADPTPVTAALRPPSLLQTCQQIRSEATPIWFLQNEFRISIIDCDITLLAKFDKLSTEIYDRCDTDKRRELLMAVDGVSSWHNLMLWCEAIWRDDISTLQPNDTLDEYERVIAGAHCITTRYRTEDREWEDCKKTLEDLKFVVGW